MILYKLKPVCYLIILLGIHIPAKSQIKSELSSRFKNDLHWDLSIDAYNLLKSGTPIMMLRYAKNPEKNALRINLGFNYDNMKPVGKIDSLSSPITLYTQSTLNYMLEGGIEFRKSNGRFQLFYGPSIKFSGYKQKTVPSDQSPVIFDTNVVTVNKLGAGVFVGVRYFILKNLAISSESSLDYYSQRSKQFFDQNSKEQAVTKAYGVEFLPLNHLHVSFFF